MAETGGAARRGRRESTLDVGQPAHRTAFATKLRELRRECGQPPYRRLSELAHCSFASLSAAAAGRRFPTWETTRGYVTACLRHAGRDADIDRVLPQWRDAWNETLVQERAHLPVLPDPPPAHVPVLATRRRSPWRAAAAAVVVLAVLALIAGGGARPYAPAPMAGLYNVVVVPFESFPTSTRGLERTLVRELEQWARDDTAIQTRGPGGVDRVPDGDARAREQALTRLGAEHNADVVLTGRIRADSDSWTVVIEMVLTDRVFSETPEFAGRHEISLTEPADVVRGNIEINRKLADEAVRYVQGVVAFVRGLGRYAMDDYVGAERDFRVADRELAKVARRITGRPEVVLLMLGNAVGRMKRYPEAAAIFRQALARNPSYVRATIGLAESLRAGTPCTRGDIKPLHQALDLYKKVLSGSDNALLAMKTRLGIGLSYQCLSLHGSGCWLLADRHFALVLRTQAAGRLTGEAGRQSLRLAAEARAGQALSAWRSGRPASATASYEEALTLLSRTGIIRPTIQARERVFLRNLRDVYREMNALTEAESADQRLRLAGGGS
jgi:tetratricopeptide (TPR) repeat protein